MSLSFSSFALWRDRAGRLSALRIVVLGLLALPAILLAARTGAGDLGPRPITEALRFCGDRAIELVVASGLVTPLRRLSGAGRLVDVRRMIGVTAALWAGLHVTLAVWDMGFDLGRVAAEIFLRPYLTLGFVALVGLAALAVTSTDGQIRRLGGPRWRRLHGLVHPMLLLALVHELLQVRLDPSHLALLCGLATAGLTVRLLAERAPPATAAVTAAAATAAAFLGAAAGEVLWFAVKTSRPLGPVVAAQFDAGFRFPPSWWAAAGTGAALLAALASARRRGGTAHRR